MTALVFTSLLILASGLFTSISLMTGFHLLMVPAIIFYSRKYQWAKFPRSGWFLLAFVLVLVLSVITNQHLIANPIKNIFKSKYYLIGALSIIPLDYYFNQFLSPEKRIKHLRILLIILLTTSSAATLIGLLSYFTHFNPLGMSSTVRSRNGGVFGMSMTYAHSIAWLSVFLIGLCFQSEKIKNIIHLRPLLFSTALALVGLYTSHARGAWLAFFAGCFVVNKKLSSFLIGLCLLLVLGSWFTNKSFFETHIVRRDSDENRLGCWLGAIKAFQEKPILGYGYLNYEPNSIKIKSQYHLPGANFGAHAHNDILEILATSGLLGGICFVFWLCFWIKETFQRKDLGTQLVFPLIISFFVSGLTQVTFNDGENVFFLMIIYALSVVL